ncbi:MAG: S1 RNA-binding domain-containing protein [Planctomycetes bacterium]|nr:S1 RNA-binding domain-containing protein [Planctomycetota bacterium]
MWFSDRLELIRTARTLHEPLAGDVAGDEGELAALTSVQDWVGSQARDCRVYPSLRVPRQDKKGKFEIDLLLLGPNGLLGLEIKHWGGRVELGRPGQWHQVSSVGAQVDHDDPLDLLGKKMDAVRTYVQEVNKVSIAHQAIHRRVVFTNPKVILGPNLSKHPDVVALPTLPSMLTPLLHPNPSGWWASFKRLLGIEATQPHAIGDPGDVSRVLDRLPTWDRITLYGGRILKGDLVRPEIQLVGSQALRRRDASVIRFSIPRSYLFGFFYSPTVSWTDSTGAARSEYLQLPQELSIRLAGQSDVERVRGEHITEIALGWRDETYYDAPRPELGTYLGNIYQGVVAGIKDFGIFVKLDEHRDGLVHISRLKRHGRSPADYRLGQQVRVKVTETRVRNGKEEISLELC